MADYATSDAYARKAINRKTYRTSLRQYLRRGLEEAGDKPLGSLASAISKRYDDPDDVPIAESTLRRIYKEDGIQSPEFAWAIGQLLWDIGAKSSSGVLALAACGCDEMLLGVLGHLVMIDVQDTIFYSQMLETIKSITIDYYVEAFMRPDNVSEFLLLGSIIREESENPYVIIRALRERQRNGDVGALSDDTTLNSHKLRDIQSPTSAQKFEYHLRCLVDANHSVNAAVSKITFEDKRALDIFDVAFKKWHPGFEYHGVLPYRFADWIDRLATATGKQADRGVREYVWQEVRAFLDTLLELRAAHDIASLTWELSTVPRRRPRPDYLRIKRIDEDP